MSDDLKDILSNLNPDIDQETLLLYLQGKLTPEKQHEIEKRMLEDEFNADALEGLSGLKDKAKIAHLVDQMNRDLQQKTRARKKKRPEDLVFQPWLLITIVIILLLIVLSYIIIYLYTRNSQ